jgi:hypothetical protein
VAVVVADWVAVAAGALGLAGRVVPLAAWPPQATSAMAHAPMATAGLTGA